ncbi:hypothetical protein TcWFU_001272 [Taenia crassiceps]|uniref:Uncharacterized protein n=1 Tax=Taenia crassiceps TaxID=6207 RepID=A0ABR4Q8M7_9CEST
MSINGLSHSSMVMMAMKGTLWKYGSIDTKQLLVSLPPRSSRIPNKHLNEVLCLLGLVQPASCVTWTPTEEMRGTIQVVVSIDSIE